MKREKRQMFRSNRIGGLQTKWSSSLATQEVQIPLGKI